MRIFKTTKLKTNGIKGYKPSQTFLQCRRHAERRNFGTAPVAKAAGAIHESRLSARRLHEDLSAHNRT